jgi:hypothetical protein
MSRSFRNGGSRHSRWRKWERRETYHRDRMQERVFCQEAKLDPSVAEKTDIAKSEPMWGKGWTGYWRPMSRWLQSRLGQPWNQVYSEIVGLLKQYTSTNNIDEIKDYLLRLVNLTDDYLCRYKNTADPNTSHHKWDFYVDDNGILRKKKYVPLRIYIKCRYTTQQIAKWLNGRVIGYKGQKLYWFIPLDSENIRSVWGVGYNYCDYGYSYYNRSGLQYQHLSHRNVYDKEGKKIGEEPVWHSNFSCRITCRQGASLKDKDLEFWNQLPLVYKNTILDWSPTNPNPPKISYW